MKIGCLLILFANITLFLWQYRHSEPVVADNLATIVLVEELKK